MPTVFTSSKITNQTLAPRRADFHNASPFQISDQIKTGARNSHPQPAINDQDCPPHPPIIPPQFPIMLYIKRWLLAGRGVFNDDKPTG